jgi:hypothetical protein
MMLKFKDQKANYWVKYPSDEVGFEREVRKGIWFRADGKETLPSPPEGYRWLIDRGGLCIGKTINYRLWSERLGYMPGQE